MDQTTYITKSYNHNIVLIADNKKPYRARETIDAAVGTLTHPLPTNE
jgi:hypothetical protein